MNPKKGQNFKAIISWFPVIYKPNRWRFLKILIIENDNKKLWGIIGRRWLQFYFLQMKNMESYFVEKNVL